MNSNRKRILLSVDGSDQSLEAVRYVGKFFPPQETEVALFHVFSRVPEFFYDLRKESDYHRTPANIKGWEKALHDSINNFLREARQILIDSEIPDEAITIDIHDRKEGVARDILVESNRGYDAIVTGRSGLSKFEDSVIGSVANKLIEKVAHIPICVVAGKPAPGKILLAMDGSENSLHTVDYLGTMLDDSQSEVTLFHVVRGFDIFERRYENLFDPTQEKAWTEIGRTQMQSVFEEARTHLMKAGLDPSNVSTKVITGVSSRSDAIIKEANEGRYGTIVVGRRGLSKVREFFMGRVSMKVIQLARKHAVWVVS